MVNWKISQTGAGGCDFFPCFSFTYSIFYIFLHSILFEKSKKRIEKRRRGWDMDMGWMDVDGLGWMECEVRLL
jgi:hypothetical protein